jgi:proton-dependent oligopeptide transporter, POT family
MGVWLLSSSVAQYVGGSIGESWGEIPPVSYFWIFVGTSVFGIALTALLAKPIRRLMHEVK